MLGALRITSLSLPDAKPKRLRVLRNARSPSNKKALSAHVLGINMRRHSFRLSVSEGFAKFGKAQGLCALQASKHPKPSPRTHARCRVVPFSYAAVHLTTTREYTKITFAGVADVAGVMLIALCCAGCKPASIQTTHPMSEEQPSRKNRVCAIRCRLFLLGYSSNIGYSLAYAYKPASGTAYSSNPRAPSPRVPPVAPCARPAMRDKRSHVRRPALHSIFAARSMVGKIAARGYMYRSSRWGAPRLWAAALSSLSALSGFSPSAGKPCNPFPLRPPPMLGRMR